MKLQLQITGRWMVMAVVLGLTWSSAAGAETIAPSKVLSPELKEAAGAFAAFWAASDERMAKLATSGITDPGSVFSKGCLKEARAKCAAVVRHAAGHSDVRDAALLVLNVYEYACESAMFPKHKRVRPKNAGVAALIGKPANGLTEGVLFKSFIIAQLRFHRLLELPALTTEAQVQAFPDIDLDKSLPGVERAPRVAIEQDHVIAIKEDGRLLLDNKPTKLADLPTVLAELNKKKGKEILVTLESDEQAKYESIVEVMNALSKAGITNVTFTVDARDLE